MNKRITVNNKTAKLRNIIIATVSVITVVFGGISIVNFILGSNIFAENSSGLTPGTPEQVLYAYLETDERIDAKLTITSTTFAGDALTCSAATSCDLSNVYIEAIGPGMSTPIKSSTFLPGYTVGTQVAIDSSTTGNKASANGVWKITIHQDPSLHLRFDWEVNVITSSGPELGRIWAEEVVLSQAEPSETADLSYYIHRHDGYLYKVSQNGYNGFGSTFNAGAFGLGAKSNFSNFTSPDAGTISCISSYTSTRHWQTARDRFPDTINDNPDDVGLGRTLDYGCDGTYRVFFNPPSSKLPLEANWFDNRATDRWVYQPTLISPVIENARYKATTGTCTSSKPTSVSNRSDCVATGNVDYAGTISVDSENYYGNALLYLDTNEDGTYERIIRFGIDSDGTTDIPFDGYDKDPDDPTRKKISVDTLVKGYIVGSRVGEVHVLSGDLEERSGGIEVERLVGEYLPGNSLASDTTKYNIFWNDTDLWRGRNDTTLTNGSQLFMTNQETGISSQGGVHSWILPGPYSLCPVIGAEGWPNGCFDRFGWSNAPGAFVQQSWGDNRTIEDWTYDIPRTAMLLEKFKTNTIHEFIITTGTTPPPSGICTMTDEEFLEHITSLPESERDAALTERAKCFLEPPDPPKPNCNMSLSQILELLDGDTKKAEEFLRACEKEGPDCEVCKSPITGTIKKHY